MRCGFDARLLGALQIRQMLNGRVRRVDYLEHGEQEWRRRGGHAWVPAAWRSDGAALDATVAPGAALTSVPPCSRFLSLNQRRACAFLRR